MAVAINCGAGALHVLRASRSTWRGLFEHLLPEFGPATVAAAAPANPRSVVAGKRLRGPARERIFAPLLARYEQGGLTEAQVAAEGGVTPTAFHMYRTQVLARRRAAAAAGGPVLKPGGKLL